MGDSREPKSLELTFALYSPILAHVSGLVRDRFADSSRYVLGRRSPEAQHTLLAVQAAIPDRGTARAGAIILKGH